METINLEELSHVGGLCIYTDINISLENNDKLKRALKEILNHINNYSCNNNTCDLYYIKMICERYV